MAQGIGVVDLAIVFMYLNRSRIAPVALLDVIEVEAYSVYFDIGIQQIGALARRRDVFPGY